MSSVRSLPCRAPLSEVNHSHLVAVTASLLRSCGVADVHRWCPVVTCLASEAAASISPDAVAASGSITIPMMRRVGYDRALDALCRDVANRTRYPRRDAMITLQADFTDQPEHLPELIKRFEGGADLVVAERTLSAKTPAPIRRMRCSRPPGARCWRGSSAARDGS